MLVSPRLLASSVQDHLGIHRACNQSCPRLRKRKIYHFPGIPSARPRADTSAIEGKADARPMWSDGLSLKSMHCPYAFLET